MYRPVWLIKEGFHMFQPISFNVIRQALEWHGLPVPKLRQLSLNDHDPDCVTGEYVASWPLTSVISVNNDYPDETYCLAVASFIHKLRSCFCQDIEIADGVPDVQGGIVTALIYVRVARGLLFWADLLDEIQA
jgi:hypothetical protein